MTQTILPLLEDGTLRLRAPVLSDVADRLALGNTPEIQYMFGVHPDETKEITLKEAQDWVTSRMATPYCWAIEHNGRLIGDAFFHTINRQDRRASLALGILDLALLGQGIGTRTLHLLMAHAFGEMALHRVTLRVLEYNTRAIAVYQKLGFTIEGQERQSARVGDTWHDDVIMGLLAPEWRRPA